jgi:hypothetical protein
MRVSRSLRLMLGVVCLILMLPGLAHAQGGRPQLVGRAILPAEFLTDGPPAGAALSSAAALINGIRVPFDSQPIGSISAVLPGQYPGTWLALSDAQFGVPDSSADYLLRFFVLELDMRRAGSGSGEANLLDRQLLADASGRAGIPIVNDETRTRYLTGADFVPRAFQRGGGAFWVAEERLPSLLRFDGTGRLLEAPIPLEGAGALQGMGVLPDGSALVIAQRAPEAQDEVIFRLYDLTTRQFSPLPGVYALEATGHSMGALVMINADEALVIELDGQERQNAQFKRIFLINVRSETIEKRLVADLLDIDDPSGISLFGEPPPEPFGLGQPFRFPFRQITALYPVDEQTLLVANNNRLPFGLGRSPREADATEFISILLPEPLPLDAAFIRSFR